MSIQSIARAVAVAVVTLLLIDLPETRSTKEYGHTVSGSSPPPPPLQTSETGSRPPPPLLPQGSLPQQGQGNATTQLMPPPPPPPLVWKKDSFPASDFRQESTTEKFLLWPDNLTYIKFAYFCQQDFYPRQELRNFTYKKGESGRLYTSPYYDLGVIDKYNTPYFRRWRIDWRIDPLRILCSVRCEYTDLQRLYVYRLYRNVLRTGFGYALATILILELGVIAFITIWSLVNHYRAGATEPLTKVLWQCFQAPEFWLDSIPDWIHLVLLTMVGFAMMEAAGHSSFFHWRSLLFYNTGVTYTYLTLAAMLSSFLYQCAIFLQTHREFQNHARSSTVVPAAQPTAGGVAANLQAVRIPSRSTSIRSAPLEHPSSEPKYSVRKTWTDDWKYQRIFGQIGVLILMVMYLSSVDDEKGDAMNSLASVVAGCLTVACIWSFAVSTVIGVRSLRSIFAIDKSWKPKSSSE